MWAAFRDLRYDASRLTNEEVHLRQVWKTRGLGGTSPAVTAHSATSEGWHVVVQATGVGTREGEPGGKPLSGHVRCSPACSFRASWENHVCPHAFLSLWSKLATISTHLGSARILTVRDEVTTD